MEVLSFSYIGVALIVIGLALITLEILAPNYCACAATGIAAVLFGVVALLDPTLPAYTLASSILLAVGISFLLLGGLAAWLAVKAHRRRVVTGVEQMTGLIGKALSDFTEEGPVEVQGERWTARVSSPVSHGQKLKIISQKGLCLDAEPA